MIAPDENVRSYLMEHAVPNSDFAVITCIFNPCNYENRRRNYEQFAAGLAKQNVPLWTIEAATHDGQFTITPREETVVQVRLPKDGWLWQKERLLNLLLPHVPKQFTKIGWVDADLMFEVDHWADLASSALDVYPIIQLFEYVRWLGPESEVINWVRNADRRPSMAAVACHTPEKAGKFQIGAPGFAWGARRTLLEKHGLYDLDIAGGGDAVMALSTLGFFEHDYFRRGSSGMRAAARAYGEQLYEDVKHFVGFIPITVSHLWHGNRKDRLYVERQYKIASLDFDPRRDIKLDEKSNLWVWTDQANPELRDYLKSYFILRNEDAQPESARILG